MMLYIALQNQISFDRAELLLQDVPVAGWVYLGEDTCWRNSFEIRTHKRIPRISIADILNRVAWDLRQPYIDWIGEYSIANDSPAWWASEIPAKDPYSHLFLQFCFFAAGKQICADPDNDPVLIICSSPALAEELYAFSRSINRPVEKVSPDRYRSWRDRLLGPVTGLMKGIVPCLPPVKAAGVLSGRYRAFLEENLMYRQKILRSLQVRPYENLGGMGKTILLLTYVDKRNFTPDGNYQDPHFGSLPGYLKERGFEIVFIPRILPTISFEEAVVRLKKTGEQFLFTELYVTGRDLRDCQNQARNYAPVTGENAAFWDMPVQRLVTECIEQTEQNLVQNLLWDPVISRMARSGIVPYQVMYTSEGQSWENALVDAVRRHMGAETRIVAYDNVTFSKLMLSMFPSRKEYGIRPFPDRLVTNGPLYYNLLAEEGYPADRLRTGCALRHAYLWQDIDEKKIAANKSSRSRISLLVASAISLRDSIDLIIKISDAFGGDPAYGIVIKCHPMIDTGLLKQSLGHSLSFPNIVISDEPVRTLLESADILFYTYTSVCYEALKVKVPPVNVRLENFLCLDKLDPVPDIRWVATTPEDLRRVVREITGMPTEQRRAWEQSAEQVVRAALSPVKPECIDSFLA